MPSQESRLFPLKRMLTLFPEFIFFRNANIIGKLKNKTANRSFDKFITYNR